MCNTPIRTYVANTQMAGNIQFLEVKSDFVIILHLIKCI